MKYINENYNSKEEAISRAKELSVKEEFQSASVILFDGVYYTEAPASDFIRTWEELIYKRRMNGWEYIKK